jgi:hypothetical protein
MAKKIKKFLKKAAKAALIGGALYGATKLGKRGKKVFPETENINIGVRGPQIEDAPYITKKPKWKMPDDPAKWQVYQAKGGRVGKKHGGRTGKQFGGGLGSTARRDMRSGYYPNDMGMRGGTMYKKGGRVKSMGIAKRGGGAAKR